MKLTDDFGIIGIILSLPFTIIVLINSIGQNVGLTVISLMMLFFNICYWKGYLGHNKKIKKMESIELNLKDKTPEEQAAMISRAVSEMIKEAEEENDRKDS